MIIFANGNCASLSFALDNRKSFDSKSIIKEGDQIIEAACYNLNNTEHICYIIKNSKDSYEILTCPLREELGDLEKSKLNRVKVSRPDDLYVVGHLINPSEKLGVYIICKYYNYVIYVITINKCLIVQYIYYKR